MKSSFGLQEYQYSWAVLFCSLAVGAWGVHVPHDLTWALEHAEAPSDQPRFRELPDLTTLPALLREIAL